MTGATGAVQGVAAIPSGLVPTVMVPTTVRVATSMAETVPGFAFELVTYAREPSDVTMMSDGPAPTVIGAPTTESVATSTTATAFAPKTATKAVDPSGVNATPPTLVPTVISPVTVLVAVSITVTVSPGAPWPT